MTKYLIYGLFDPLTGELGYIGKSCSGMKRPKAHLNDRLLDKLDTHCVRWLKVLRGAGRRPEIDIIEEHSEGKTLGEAERFWIQYFRGIGCRLTNIQPGGESVYGRRSSSSSPLKGVKRSIEVSRRISEGLQGKKKSAEHVEKIAAFFRGRQLSLEHRAKVSLSLLGNIRRKGKFQPLVECIKKSRSAGGRPFVDELGRHWETQGQAARHFGVRQGHISECLAGIRSSVRGHIFQYQELP